jgi:hypothetical protein
VNPDFFNIQQQQISNKDTAGHHYHADNEYDAVGILPRTLRDLFTQLEQKRRSLNSTGEEEVEGPINNNDENNTLYVVVQLQNIVDVVERWARVTSTVQATFAAKAKQSHWAAMFSTCSYVGG